MNSRELEKELRRGKIRPAYLLAGSEALLRDECLEAIRAAVLDGSADDFNADRLWGEHVSPAQILDSVRALPVMASRRLVILSEPEEKKRGGAAQAVTEALRQAVEELRDREETVLVVTATKVDGRARWVKGFKDPAVHIKCDPPKSGAPLLAFIDGEARSQGVTLGPGARELLAERIGPQLLVLRGEIAKAALLAGPDQAVSRDHIAISSSEVAERFIWDLTDAIGAGQTGVAVTQLGRLLAGGAAPEALLGALASHFRKLACLRAGASVKGQPFYLRKLESQSRRYSQLALRECLESIHGADASLKGRGFLGRELALESLVIDLSN